LRVKVSTLLVEQEEDKRPSNHVLPT